MYINIVYIYVVYIMMHAIECHVQFVLDNYTNLQLNFNCKRQLQNPKFLVVYSKTLLAYLVHSVLPLSHFTLPYPICLAFAPLCLAPKKPQ